MYVFDVIYGFLRLKTICVPKFDPVGYVELTLLRKQEIVISLIQTRMQKLSVIYLWNRWEQGAPIHKIILYYSCL